MTSLTNLPPSPVRIEGSIAVITTIGGIEAVVDAADIHLAEQHRWYARILPHTTYVRCRMRSADGGVRVIALHQVILGPSSRRRQIDHVSGDGLDNRRGNLRFATPAENSRNSRKRPGTLSKFKGVTYSRIREKWQAQIKIDGQSIYLGQFESEQSAHDAYVAVAAKFHGRFARPA